MEKIKELLKKITSTIIIKPDDSETDRAKKLIWYAFFGSIVALFVVSWIIFVLLTFNNDTVKVPNIEKENIYVALKKLSERRLVANVSPKYSDNYGEGVVFSQNPMAGLYVKKGRVINFSVSLGDLSFALKDFRGFFLAEFYQFLKETYPNGKTPFKVIPAIYEFSDTIEKGKIIRQIPEDGTPIKNVKEIKLWVSNGIKDKEYKLLPNFVGKKLNDQAIKDTTMDVSKYEILYTIKYELIKNRALDNVITAQSIGQNAIIEDIVKEEKVLELTVNKYFMIDGEKINGVYNLELPKKPIPYLLNVRSVGGDKLERDLLSINIKGGVIIPIHYSNKIVQKLNIYINGELYKSLDISEYEKGLEETK